MENLNKPAFPLDAQSEEQITEGYGKGYMGLTKFEYFTAIAMQGLLSGNVIEKDSSIEKDVKLAIKYAKEILKQLNNEQ